MRTSLILLFLLTFGCSQTIPIEGPKQFSESWFRCEGRFECVVVYDAFCKKKAINSAYALAYQDWAYREVHRLGEGKVCPDPDLLNDAAGCRANQCVFPFGWEDYPKDPKAK